MNEATSPYYPRRARWYRRLLQPWFEVKRALRLESIPLPEGVSFGNLVLGLLIPGHAFRLFGWKHIALLAQLAFALEAAVFIVALGYLAANLAFGLMISTHATSIIYLLGRWTGAQRLWLRLATAVAALLVVSQLIYFPLRGLVESYLVPLRVDDKVVVVKKGVLPENIQRGDMVAYEIRGLAGDNLYIREGYGFDAVLALPGDRVTFTTNSFAVNGVAYPPHARMPAAGEVLVPEKHWFIWPRLDINNRNVPGAGVSTAMLQMAIVSENQYVGRPFRHWFGRRQLLAPPP